MATKDHSYKKPKVNLIGNTGTTSKGYNWVNDPFSDVLPYERHNKVYDKRNREERLNFKVSKGRAANL